MRDNTCVCDHLVSLDQTKCAERCGPHQKEAGGRCVCADHYRQSSGDSENCAFRLKAAEYAGVCVGAALLLALIILVTILIIKQKAKKKQEREQLSQFRSAGNLQFNDDSSVQMRAANDDFSGESQANKQ